MNKTLIFFCISCCLLVFSIIVICTGPVITGIVDDSWRTLNCQHYHDQHKYIDKNQAAGDFKDALLKHLKEGQHFCERKKALYGLEYAALVSDLFFGVLCSLLSLLHYFGVGNYCQKVTGIIGLACGVIGFVLTLIYIIYSGYIFTNDGPGKSYSLSPSSLSDVKHYASGTFKLDKDRAFAEWKDGKYKCFYYKEDNEDSSYAKYSDLGKKQYNYHKDFSDITSDYNNNDCYIVSTTTSPIAECKTPTITTKKCDKLYYHHSVTEISNKYEYDKWVTSIIFGCFIIALNIGLALFGFLLFSDSSNGSTPLK